MTDENWRGIGWDAAVRRWPRSRRFFRALTDAELVEYRRYPNEGCTGVNAGRAWREMRRREATKP